MADTSLTGAWPIDPETETGLFRTELGDVDGIPHEPADDKAEFQYLGDAQIAALLLAYPTSRDRAMSKAVSSMAKQLIIAAQDIQVDDIRLKTIENARLMLEYAQSLDGGVSAVEADSAFSVVALTTHNFGYPRPQGTPYPEVG